MMCVGEIWIGNIDDDDDDDDDDGACGWCMWMVHVDGACG